MPPTLEISEARKQLMSMDTRLQSDRVVVVTRHNKKAFALVDLDYLASIVSVVKAIELMRSDGGLRALSEGVDEIGGRFTDPTTV
jgi:PHD/YefM family antitoxin component YafN of YafNO toxin-antitoxin module